MCFTGNKPTIYEESSVDASMANQECSEDLSMLYLLASVAEAASCEKLHALASAAEPAKTDVVADQLPVTTAQVPPKIQEKTGCDEERLFRLKCPFCCRCFSRKENLRWHVVKKHDQENVADNATVRTVSRDLLPDQLVTGKANTRVVSAAPDLCGFWCVSCEKCFQREATFRVHMRFHARRRQSFSIPLPCKWCSEVRATKTQYLIHKEKHYLEKGFRKRAAGGSSFKGVNVSSKKFSA